MRHVACGAGLVGVAATLFVSTACVPGGGIGGDSFDPELIVTIPSLEGDPAWEAEPVPLVVDILGAPQGATVTASKGGLPQARFHWPDTDRGDLILGDASSTWTFLLTVTEDEGARYRDSVDLEFAVHWSNPDPAEILACVDAICAPATHGQTVSGPLRLRPGGALDDMVEARWTVDDQDLGAGDPADGGITWTWDDPSPASHDVRVQVVRDGGLDSFGVNQFVTQP